MRPRCYTGIRMDTLPVTYRANKKARITSEIFNQWLSEWNSRLQRQSRRILLLIDNCPAHKLIGNYTNIDIHFLPANTTSVLQPMDQGIIKNFKFYYRRCLVNRYIAAIENRQGNDEIKISVRDAVDMSTMAWNEVKVSTIANCFRKAGFVKQVPGDIAEHEINFQEAADKLQYEGVDDTTWNSIQDHLGFSTTFEEYVDIDSQICTTQELTEESIVESVIAAKALRYNC